MEPQERKGVVGTKILLSKKKKLADKAIKRGITISDILREGIDRILDEGNDETEGTG
jgi:hypothetical protein